MGGETAMVIRQLGEQVLIPSKWVTSLKKLHLFNLSLPPQLSLSQSAPRRHCLHVSVPGRRGTAPLLLPVRLAGWLACQLARRSETERCNVERERERDGETERGREGEKDGQMYTFDRLGPLAKPSTNIVISTPSTKEVRPRYRLYASCLPGWASITEGGGQIETETLSNRSKTNLYANMSPGAVRGSSVVFGVLSTEAISKQKYRTISKWNRSN